MGYIGTEIAAPKAAMKVEPGASLVDPKTEATLMAAIKQLLRD